MSIIFDFKHHFWKCAKWFKSNIPIILTVLFFIIMINYHDKLSFKLQLELKYKMSSTIQLRSIRSVHKQSGTFNFAYTYYVLVIFAKYILVNILNGFNIRNTNIRTILNKNTRAYQKVLSLTYLHIFWVSHFVTLKFSQVL